ncbi:hypothetical protein CO610_09895 [Lysobacteraceae bacterium NML95-0200]|nr:hypothetical protein CO610_09895 [Xanthomonadaceae bacterium NML95-0200]
MTARARHALWQAVSIVLHPFWVLAGLWLLALWQHRAEAFWAQAWPMLLAITVCAAYVLWRWRRGDWGTVDASDKRERASLYAVILPVILALALWQGGWASVTGRALLYFALALMLAWLGNRWLKTSLHLLGLGFAVPVAWQLCPWVGVLLAACLPLLAASRLALGRHTLLEVMAGSILGLAAGVWALI